MDIKIVGASQTDLEKLEERDQHTIEGSSGDDISTIAINQVLELENSDAKKYESEVSTLLEWAKQNADSEDPSALKWAVRDLQLRVSTPPFGDRIKHIARFAYLDLEEQRIKKEKESFR